MISIDTTAARLADIAFQHRIAAMGTEIDVLVKSLVHDGAERIRAVTPRSDNPFASPDKEHIQDNWEEIDLGIGRGAIGNALPEVEFLFEDTAPNEITPAEALVLHFGVGGDEVFARSVQHPGTTANQTMIDTLYSEQDRASAALAVYGDFFVVETALALDRVP